MVWTRIKAGNPMIAAELAEAIKEKEAGDLAAATARLDAWVAARGFDAATVAALRDAGIACDACGGELTIPGALRCDACERTCCAWCTVDTGWMGPYVTCKGCNKVQCGACGWGAGPRGKKDVFWPCFSCFGAACSDCAAGKNGPEHVVVACVNQKYCGNQYSHPVWPDHQWPDKTDPSVACVPCARKTGWKEVDTSPTSRRPRTGWCRACNKKGKLVTSVPAAEALRREIDWRAWAARNVIQKAKQKQKSDKRVPPPPRKDRRHEN